MLTSRSARRYGRRADHSAGHLPGAGRPSPAQHGAELVPAEPDEGFSRQHGAQPVGDLHEQDVAGGMAETVEMRAVVPAGEPEADQKRTGGGDDQVHRHAQP